MANDLLSLAGWYFLPNLVTGYLQTALYAVFIRAGDPKPAPGSVRFVKDRRRILIFVILAYLFYTIYEADYQLQQAGDFYSLLGVQHGVEERAIQSKFRRLTVQYHPDKASGSDKAVVEAIYVQLKLARDTLVDPAKHFAYDRFGPEILQWRQCKTIRDYVFHGIQNTSIYYGGSGGVLVLLGLLGYFQQGKFWRYLVMASMYVIEVHTMMRPDFPMALTSIINPVLVSTGLRRAYLPYQMLTLLRKLAVTFFIAMSQLGPILKGPQTGEASADSISPQQLEKLDVLARATDQEINRLMGLELMPYMSDEGTKKDLRSSLKDWLMQNTVRNDPEVKAAIGAVLERRRAEGQIGQQRTD
ncbi:membrane associated DnaJ chaperone-like protein [Hortaea werneckii]|uniref:J domain-containing protein n=2 Tax=Hortaea werneckii TaxID=91943 RepID=A0A3M7IS81_HORWE|nr:membrane associated DnaJ chaperone-like protein [Hortaea werneckii]OTA38739.1 hypothetical protein BTJ68_01206 [Hortaea werneckii EXF-2000]KAI6839188.1 membrane associated DnaJ chaperone-like protein [Hortaea werneckii]KAI6844345.1 membrane associated DnaJ chaperone-like protein [Hortaea werneckii]KAI6937159.1 membrane associated DnaJ chaperone-like protein [Hortaea werneckii]